MITFKDYLEHNHPEVLDEAWWHPLLAGAALATTGLAGGGPSAQGASPITSEIRNVNTQAKEEFIYLKTRFDKQLNKFGYKYNGLLMNKPRGGNYHWIDNHIVRATRYDGRWGELIKVEHKIEVFK